MRKHIGVRVHSGDGSIGRVWVELEGVPYDFDPSKEIFCEVGVGGADLHLKLERNKGGELELHLYAPINCFYRVTMGGKELDVSLPPKPGESTV